MVTLMAPTVWSEMLPRQQWISRDTTDKTRGVICRYEYWARKNVCLIGIAGGPVAGPVAQTAGKDAL